MAITLAEVRQRIEEIEGELAALKAEGEILRGFWIDSTGGGKYKYYRLRWYCGQDEETGKELSYGYRRLEPSEVASTRAAIKRGKRVAALEKKLVVVRAELVRKETLVRELGLLPEPS
jgi:hypothetical protein